MRAVGGSQSCTSVTSPVGMLPLRHSPNAHPSRLTTGVVDSLYGPKKISGTFRAIRSLSYPPLTSCVEEHLVVAKNPRETQKIRIRETQTSANLDCLSYLYTFPDTRALRHGDETWVLGRVSIHRGTIEQLEDEIFNVDELDSAAEVRLRIKRWGAILKISAVDTEKLEEAEKHFQMQISFAQWFKDMVGIGILHPLLKHHSIDPAKLRSVHNRSHLQGLYFMPFDIAMVNAMEVDPVTWARTDWDAVKTIGDIPEGLVIEMKTLVNVAEGHEQGYIEDIFPADQRIKYDDMKYGIAFFTVEREDNTGFIVNWTNASNLADNGMDEALVQKFRAQAVSVYKPDETSLRLAADNSLQTPAEWVRRLRRESSKPSTAVSSLGYAPDERDTLRHFAMDEASTVG